MARNQNWRQKFFGLLALCLLIVSVISACDVNTTSQDCDGVVNVNSCTSSNSISIQATAEELATVQANINATATVVIKVQNTTTKDQNLISIGIIIIPLTLLLSIIALLFSLGQDAIAPKITLGIVTILLIILTVIAVVNVANLGINI